MERRGGGRTTSLTRHSKPLALPFPSLPLRAVPTVSTFFTVQTYVVHAVPGIGYVLATTTSPSTEYIILFLLFLYQSLHSASKASSSSPSSHLNITPKHYLHLHPNQAAKEIASLPSNPIPTTKPNSLTCLLLANHHPQAETKQPRIKQTP